MGRIAGKIVLFALPVLLVIGVLRIVLRVQTGTGDFLPSQETFFTMMNAFPSVKTWLGNIQEYFVEGAVNLSTGDILSAFNSFLSVIGNALGAITYPLQVFGWLWNVIFVY